MNSSASHKAITSKKAFSFIGIGILLGIFTYYAQGLVNQTVSGLFYTVRIVDLDIEYVNSISATFRLIVFLVSLYLLTTTIRAKWTNKRFFINIAWLLMGGSFLLSLLTHVGVPYLMELFKDTSGNNSFGKGGPSFRLGDFVGFVSFLFIIISVFSLFWKNGFKLSEPNYKPSYKIENILVLVGVGLVLQLISTTALNFVWLTTFLFVPSLGLTYTVGSSIVVGLALFVYLFVLLAGGLLVRAIYQKIDFLKVIFLGFGAILTLSRLYSNFIHMHVATLFSKWSYNSEFYDSIDTEAVAIIIFVENVILIGITFLIAFLMSDFKSELADTKANQLKDSI